MIEINGKRFINPDETIFNDHCYELSYYPDTSFIVLAKNLQEALEILGEYCRKNNFDGLIETNINKLFSEYTKTEINENFFPVNGGEFYLDLPELVQEISEPAYDYSITYETITENSAEYGDAEEKGFIVESDTATLSQLISLCKDYNLTSCQGSQWLYNTEPLHDDDFFRHGIETYYGLHINGQDYNNKEILELIENIINQ